MRLTPQCVSFFEDHGLGETFRNLLEYPVEVTVTGERNPETRRGFERGPGPDFNNVAGLYDTISNKIYLNADWWERTYISLGEKRDFPWTAVRIGSIIIHEFSHYVNDIGGVPLFDKVYDPDKKFPDFGYAAERACLPWPIGRKWRSANE